MELYVNIKMNEKLYLRNPQETELGRRIIEYSIKLIHKTGFESFTFKKLAASMKTTEASIYRYFENKHRLLIYLSDWYWSWLEYRIVIETKNMSKPELKLKKAIELLVVNAEKDSENSGLNLKLLYEIVMSEGAKSYLTKHVTEDNKAKLFKPYKDLCARISGIITELNPKYKFPRSLSSTLIEVGHSHKYFMKHLPSLTDFPGEEDEKLMQYLEHLAFQAIGKKL